MRIHVIYKVCEKVDSVHGLPRPFGLNKRQVIDSCLRSLSKSLNGLDAYTSVVADNISQELESNITRELKPVNFFHNQDAPDYRKTMVKAAEFAEQTDDENYIYFVEDDYLHDATFFAARVNDFFELVKTMNFALPCFMHPSDYPDQYSRLLSRNYIFQGRTGYWREVSSSTETYFAPAKFYKSKAQYLKQSYINDGVNGIGSDYQLSLLFKKEALCFSPLPGIATHMHEYVMSNYVDWSKMI